MKQSNKDTMGARQKKIISYDELHDPGSKGLIITIDNTQLSLFVVKRDKQIFVYENSCPHTLGPLDWAPDSFLDEDNHYIMCANHGALFQIEDGLCVYGPCKKQSLRTLPYVLENGDIYLLI